MIRVSHARFFLVSLLLVSMILWVPSVRGAPQGPDARARHLFAKAQAMFLKNQFDEALDFYHAAYELKPLPGFLFNIAQCHRFAGRFEQAIQFYNRYLATGSSVHSRADVEKLLRHVTDRLSQAAQSAAPGSQPAAASGSSVKEPSRRVLPTTSTDPVRNGAVDLEAGGHMKAAGSATGAAAVRKEVSNRSRILLWSGVGLSTALLITALTTGQLASDQSDEYKDLNTSKDRRIKLRSSGQTLATTSIVTFALTAALGTATGLYAWLGYGRSQPVVSAVASGKGGLLAVGGGF